MREEPHITRSPRSRGVSEFETSGGTDRSGVARAVRVAVTDAPRGVAPSTPTRSRVRLRNVSDSRGRGSKPAGYDRFSTRRAGPESVRAHSISRRSSWRPWYRTGHRRFVRGSSDARSAAPRRCPPCGRHVGSPAGPRRRARIPHPGKTRWRSREPDRTIARRRGVTDEVDVRGGVTNGSLFESHVVAARDRRQGRRSP